MAPDGAVALLSQLRRNAEMAAWRHALLQTDDRTRSSIRLRAEYGEPEDNAAAINALLSGTASVVRAAFDSAKRRRRGLARDDGSEV